MHYLFIYSFLGLLIQINNYHPSCGYINANLRDYLCADRLIVKVEKAILGNLGIKLTEGRSSAAIVQQVWNTTTTSFRSTNKIRPDCEFRVQTIQARSRTRGVYARITISRFRRHPDTKECLDYVQFMGDKYISSAKHCNNASLDDDSSRIVLVYQSNRELAIRVHIDTVYAIVKPIKFHAVFTAHSECRHSSDILCDPNNHNSCISGSFQCDNITNCIPSNQDENICSAHIKPSAELDSTNIVLSATISFVLTMLGVGFCLWICWKYWNCTIGRQHEYATTISANRNENQNVYPDHHVVPIVELPPTSDIMLNSVNSNDPHASQQNLQRQNSKDLPPSYESLFPDGSPTT